jgi:hypothetical protein
VSKEEFDLALRRPGCDRWSVEALACAPVAAPTQVDEVNCLMINELTDRRGTSAAVR